MEQAFTYCSLRSGSSSKPTSRGCASWSPWRDSRREPDTCLELLPYPLPTGPRSRAQPPALGLPGLEHGPRGATVHLPPCVSPHWFNQRKPVVVLLLSRFSRVRLCATPETAAHQSSPVPGILQARTLEWVAISSNAWKWKVKVKSLSRVQLFATPWTAAHQAPPSMGFSRQEYWSGVPLPSLLLS